MKSALPVTNEAGPKTPRIGILWLALAFFIGASVSIHAQQPLTASKTDTMWERLDQCRLLTNAAVDGDSFHVAHKGREYIFRLYFVDAPESDPTLRERIVDQAAYFGVAADQIPVAGRAAGQFTSARLAGTNFTVITRWQNAMGRSSLARFYAVVLVGDENLAELLVAQGMARIYGLHANWPDGPRATTFINKLKNLELAAREKRAGLWDTNRFHPTATSAEVPPVTHSETNTPAPNPELLDINSATAAELDKLPGIGPALANRIIAARPFKSVEDLRRVSGIGPTTLERLRPLVRAGQSAFPPVQSP